jgi:hypothetical protein
MDDGGSHDALRRALAWSAHPISVAGLVLLLANDHLFKAWQPGPVTGKLSDVAGMLMFPPLLAVLVAVVAPRIPARALAVGALAATGAGFAFVKATAYGAQLASQAWSMVNEPSLVRADVTDLLALPALTLCWWAWQRTARRPAPGRRTARLVRGALLLPVALLATTATTASPEHGPEAILLHEDGGRLVLGVNGRFDVEWAVSADDGLTWTALDGEPDGATALQASKQDCAGRVCYRVVTGELRVESSADGGATWQTAWEISGSQLAKLSEAYERRGLFGPTGEPTGDLMSFALVVREVGNEHVVLVANGRDGILRRGTDGRWTRLGSWHGGVLESPPALA